MAELIDGRALAAKFREQVAREVDALVRETGVVPALAAVLVGDAPASAAYVRSKETACRKAGIRCVVTRLPNDTTQVALLETVSKLNLDPAVHGILVELPLPKHLSVESAVEAISPAKDVDGFHPENLGLLFRGRPRFVPCTPAGVLHALKSLAGPLAGLHAVVVGRSLVVGRPLAVLLLQENMTVTICHSRTRDLAAEVARGDVVVAAAGAPGLVKGEWVKRGATVVDVGTNALPDGSLVGDVEFDAAAARAGRITPVPGGVGPLTVALLLGNVLKATKLHLGRAAGTTT